MADSESSSNTGVVAILVVIFAPSGIVGLWREMVERFVHRP